MYGGRNVVGPGGPAPSASAITPSVVTPAVLPWSCAVPIVVYRLTCSAERMPAPVARSTSATVASRCRSTKWVSHRPSGAGIVHSGWFGSSSPFADPTETFACHERSGTNAASASS